MILNLYIDIFDLRSRSIVPSMIEAVETVEKSKKKLQENISSSKYTLLRLNVCLFLTDKCKNLALPRGRFLWMLRVTKSCLKNFENP